MLQTYEAVIADNGNVQLLEPVTLPSGWHVLVTVLYAQPETVSETALLSEPALAEEWNLPEEDEAWTHLQQAM